MPIKTVDGYEIDYTAEPLQGCDDWGAYVAIFAPSDNPMHMNNIVPKKRVAADIALTSEAMAEQEAEKAAMEILGQLRPGGGISAWAGYWPDRPGIDEFLIVE